MHFMKVLVLIYGLEFCFTHSLKDKSSKNENRLKTENVLYFLKLYLSIVRAPATHPKTPRADLAVEIKEFISL